MFCLTGVPPALLISYVNIRNVSTPNNLIVEIIIPTKKSLTGKLNFKSWPFWSFEGNPSYLLRYFAIFTNMLPLVVLGLKSRIEVKKLI